jgi:hypothetical protein
LPEGIPDTVIVTIIIIIDWRLIPCYLSFCDKLERRQQIPIEVYTSAFRIFEEW